MVAHRRNAEDVGQQGVDGGAVGRGEQRIGDDACAVGAVHECAEAAGVAPKHRMQAPGTGGALLPRTRHAQLLARQRLPRAHAPVAASRAPKARHARRRRQGIFVAEHHAERRVGRELLVRRQLRKRRRLGPHVAVAVALAVLPVEQRVDQALERALAPRRCGGRAPVGHRDLGRGREPPIAGRNGIAHRARGAQHGAGAAVACGVERRDGRVAPAVRRGAAGRRREGRVATAAGRRGRGGRGGSGHGLQPRRRIMCGALMFQFFFCPTPSALDRM